MSQPPRLSNLVERVAESLKAFKKFREEHPFWLIFGSAVGCVTIGWSANDLTLSWRGKMVIDSAAYSPALAARGLWDNDHPSPKAIELARTTPSVGQHAIRMLADRSIAVGRRAALVEVIADLAETRARCDDLSSASKDAYRKIDGMLGGETYMADRDRYRDLRRREVECWNKAATAEKEIGLLLGMAVGEVR